MVLHIDTTTTTAANDALNKSPVAATKDDSLSNNLVEERDVSASAHASTEEDGNCPDVSKPYNMVGRLEVPIPECGENENETTEQKDNDTSEPRDIAESANVTSISTDCAATGAVTSVPNFDLFGFFCGMNSPTKTAVVNAFADNGNVESEGPTTIDIMERNLELRKLGVKKANEVLLPPKPIDDDILGPEEENEQKKDCELSDELQLEFMCRRKIAGQVFGEFLVNGFSLREIPCLKCGMYLMEKDGIVNCKVCPVLAKEIKVMIETNRTRYFVEKKEFARKTITEAKTNAFKRTQRLQQLKAMEIEAKANLFSKTAGAEVSAEESDSATQACLEAEKKLMDRMQLSEEAWSLLKKRNEEEAQAIQDSKNAIEKAMIAIEESVMSRKMKGATAVQKRFEADADKTTAEKELSYAKLAQQQADAECRSAAEAVRKALAIQAAAEEANKEALMLVKSKEENLASKEENISNTETNNKKMIVDAEDHLKTVTDKAAEIENDAALQIENCQNMKAEASLLAKKRDEEKWITEARTIVSKQVMKMAKEAKEVALKEAEIAKKKADEVAALRAGEEAKYALEEKSDEAQICAVSRYLDDTDLTYDQSTM